MSGTVIHLALVDPGDGGRTIPVGAFSSGEKARSACQAREDRYAERFGTVPPRLEWRGTQAQCDDGERYTVVPAELDVPL